MNFIFRLDKNVPQQPVFFKTKRFASPWEAGGENDARNGTEVDKVIWTIFLSEVAIGTGKKSLDKNHLISVVSLSLRMINFRQEAILAIFEYVIFCIQWMFTRVKMMKHSIKMFSLVNSVQAFGKKMNEKLGLIL